MNEDKPLAKLYNRDSLFEKFKNGRRPEEKDFEDLINSTINKLDDGIAKSFKSGLELAPKGESAERLISLFEKLNDTDPAWVFNLKGKVSKKSLHIESVAHKNSIMSFTTDNKVGVNKENAMHELDVAGTIGMQRRVGTYASDRIPANGQWFRILSGLKGVNAFELIASANGKEGQGKYALLHANLLNAYRGKNGKIKRTQDYYGWKWWHRLKVRWTGSPFNYNLELKSASNYGEEATIDYHICQLL